MRTYRKACLVLAVVTLCPFSSGELSARDLFVDSQLGDNIADGRSEQPVDEFSGPVKTISRALRFARPGDTVHIANRGVPYFESLEVVGRRFSGGFAIEGNGAVVSGARTIPFEAWKLVGNNVWRFTPFRKAWYQLIEGEKAVPEYPCPSGATSLPEIPVGQWCAWRGSIYYHSQKGVSPALGDIVFAFAAEEVGITLLDVDDVTIHNLELRHFRLDGVNAHDRARNVVLDSVRLIENGRAGLAVGGSSLVGLKDSTVEGNRVTQLLNAEVAQTEVLTSHLGPPVLDADAGALRIKGGHVLIDGEEVFERAR
jgi:hypothetical protein